MRLLLVFFYAAGLSMAPIWDLKARDSATLVERSTAGFSLPSANRAEVAARAQHATRAEFANRADHAETARIAHELVGSGTPPPAGEGTGIVCGPGGEVCGSQEPLQPGTYVVRCGSHPHDSMNHQTTVIITGSGGRGAAWAGCPGPTTGRFGIANRYLQWISRVG